MKEEQNNPVAMTQHLIPVMIPITRLGSDFYANQPMQEMSIILNVPQSSLH